MSRSDSLELQQPLEAMRSPSLTVKLMGTAGDRKKTLDLHDIISPLIVWYLHPISFFQLKTFDIQ